VNVCSVTGIMVTAGPCTYQCCMVGIISSHITVGIVLMLFCKALHSFTGKINTNCSFLQRNSSLSKEGNE